MSLGVRPGVTGGRIAEAFSWPTTSSGPHPWGVHTVQHVARSFHHEEPPGHVYLPSVIHQAQPEPNLWDEPGGSGY
jgi:hypothetical protein